MSIRRFFVVVQKILFEENESLKNFPQKPTISIQEAFGLKITVLQSKIAKIQNISQSSQFISNSSF